jgi:MFS transporter, UMF1 family
VSVAVLYAQTELGASITLLLIATVVVPLVAGIGAIVWPIIQRKLGWSTRKLLILHCILYTLLPIYGLLFLKSQNEIIPLAVLHGFLLGGLLV